MKEMFKGLGDFLVGLSKLILICGAVVLLARGLDWFFEKTLPWNAIGIPPLILSIIILCGIVLLLIWVMEKRDKKHPVKRESNPMTEYERQESNANFHRGWLCLLTGFAVLMMTLDMDNIQARLEMCAIAAVVAWPVTVIRKVKKRPGLYALALLCVWLIYGGSYLVWDGMTHVGPGWQQAPIGGGGRDMGGGYDVDTEDEQVSQSEYRRNNIRDGVMLLLFGAGAVGTLIHLWREKDKLEKEKAELEKSWEQVISNPHNVEKLRQHPEFYADDFKQWVEENHPNLLLQTAVTEKIQQDEDTPDQSQTAGITTKRQPKEQRPDTTPKNSMKTKILIIALAVFILTCLFPPWLNVLDVPYHAHQRTPAGHEFFLFPPDSKGGAWSVEVDLKMLFVEWAALAAITGAVWLIVVKPPWLRDDKANRPQKFIPPPGNPKN